MNIKPRHLYQVECKNPSTPPTPPHCWLFAILSEQTDFRCCCRWRLNSRYWRTENDEKTLRFVVLVERYICMHGPTIHWSNYKRSVLSERRTRKFSIYSSGAEWFCFRLWYWDKVRRTGNSVLVFAPHTHTNNAHNVRNSINSDEHTNYCMCLNIYAKCWNNCICGQN